jgi:hypothetical protein
LKRYILFTYDSYYPSGGLGDMVDKFDTIEEIYLFLCSKNSVVDNYDILDTHTGEELSPFIINYQTRKYEYANK